jgi:hypothetical protein
MWTDGSMKQCSYSSIDICELHLEHEASNDHRNVGLQPTYTRCHHPEAGCIFLFCCLLESIWCTRTWSANMILFCEMWFWCWDLHFISSYGGMTHIRDCYILPLICSYAFDHVLALEELRYDALNIIHTSLSITAYT